jgi:hypothetical protein
MDRRDKVAKLLAKAEDVRRLALDDLDALARRTNTWGTKEHRSGRDRVENTFDQEALRLERLEDPALDRELETV